MVTITDRAKAHVKKLIQDNKLGDVQLRIGVTGGGCSGFNYNLTFEKESKPGDKVYDYGDVKIFVDKLSRPFIGNTEIDFTDNLYGSGFSFANPQAESTCGCGQSFAAKEDAATGGQTGGH